MSSPFSTASKYTKENRTIIERGMFYGLHYLRAEAKYHVRKGQEREERDIEAASFFLIFQAIQL